MEEGLPKVPKLELAQFKFVLSKEKSNTTTYAQTVVVGTSSTLNTMKETLLAEIVKDSTSARFGFCFSFLFVRVAF